MRDKKVIPEYINLLTSVSVKTFFSFQGLGDMKPIPASKLKSSHLFCGPPDGLFPVGL